MNFTNHLLIIVYFYQMTRTILNPTFYVDDVLIKGALEEDIAKVEKHLHKLFTIEDIEYAKYFFGL